MTVAQANKKLKKATDKIASAIEDMHEVYTAIGYSYEKSQLQIIHVLQSWEDEIKHG